MTSVRHEHPPGLADVGIASVANAARLLRQFGLGESELGVTELARRLNLSKTTVHRLVSTLAAEHLLERDPQTSRYRLALTMYDLGSLVSVRRELHQAGSSVVTAVRGRSGLSTHLTLLNGRYVSYAERSETDPHAKRMTREFPRVPANLSAGGRVLLADLPAAGLAELMLGWRLPARTAHSITDHATLHAELNRVREQGYAIVRDEIRVGTMSIAVPVLGAIGRADAALSVGAETPHLVDRNPEILRMLNEAAHHISRRLVGIRADTRHA